MGKFPASSAATLVIALFALASRMESVALNMNVQTDEQEKLAYVNLWDPIERGDDEKFRALVTPSGGTRCAQAHTGAGPQRSINPVKRTSLLCHEECAMSTFMLYER